MLSRSRATLSIHLHRAAPTFHSVFLRGGPNGLRSAGMFRLTRKEKALVLGILCALVVGAGTKIYRAQSSVPQAIPTNHHADR